LARCSETRVSDQHHERTTIHPNTNITPLFVGTPPVGGLTSARGVACVTKAVAEAPFRKTSPIILNGQVDDIGPIYAQVALSDLRPLWCAQVLHSISDHRLDIIRGMDKYVEEQVRGETIDRCPWSLYDEGSLASRCFQFSSLWISAGSQPIFYPHPRTLTSWTR